MPRTPASLSGLQFSTNPNAPGYISVPNIAALQGLTALTVEAQVYIFNNLTANSGKIATNNATNTGFGLQVNTAGQLSMVVANGTSNASATFNNAPLGAWHHVAGTWDGTNIKVYLDGVAGTTTALAGGNTGNPGIVFQIGNSTASNRSFPGIVSELRISNSVRYTAAFTPPSMQFNADANTIGLYHLNEGQGTIANDSSSQANHGTLSGVPLPVWSDGKFLGGGTSRTNASNRASVQQFMASLSFNGTSSKVIAPSISGLGSGLTFATWYKSSAVLTVQKFMANATSATDEASLTLAFANIQAAYFDGTTTHAVSTLNATSPTPGAWNHVVFTYDGTIPKLYVNGIAQAGSAAPSFAATSAFTLGARNDSSQFFLGSMAQSLVYKRAISQTEAQLLYNTGIIPATPFAQYNLNEGSGTTAYDTSGNGNNGTITAGTYTADVPTTKRKLVGDNLVYNGNFEYAPPTNVALTTPSVWIDGTSGGNGNNPIFGVGLITHTGSGNTQFDNTTSHSGNYSLKVSTTATGSNIQASSSITSSTSILPSIPSTIPVLPSTSYTLSFWMKTTANSGSATTGAQFTISERDATGAQTVATSTAGVTATTGWTQYFLTITTNSATRFVTLKYIVTGNNGTGTLIMDAWFDDIVLVPTVNTTRGLAI